jgi:hypothetical protein
MKKMIVIFRLMLVISLSPLGAQHMEKALALKPAEVGVRYRFEVKGFNREEKNWGEWLGKKRLSVVFFIQGDCPISKLNLAKQLELIRLYSDQEVQFLFASVAPLKNESMIQLFAENPGLEQMTMDWSDLSMQQDLNASRTTECLIFDERATLQYRGAFSDQYGLGFKKEQAGREYVKQALAALLNEQKVEWQATTAPGCELDQVNQVPTNLKRPLTYCDQVSRVIQANCLECHDSGGVAPFELTSYESLIEHAGMIKKMVEKGAMPPWFADGKKDGSHYWKNDRSLTVVEKQVLLGWLSGERARGDELVGPVTKKKRLDWSLKRVDEVLRTDKPILVKATGIMPYQRVQIKTHFNEDKWVVGYEIRPKHPSVVHHVLVHVMDEKKGKLRQLVNRSEGREDGYWAAYVPGNTSRVYSEGFARRLKAGAVLQMQIHYTPKGKEVEDEIEIGLQFSDQPPAHEIHTIALSNPRLMIPAHEQNHQEIIEKKIPKDITILSMMAHMHLRGKSAKLEWLNKGGSYEVLMNLPHYDFNWQLSQDLVEPLPIKAGEKLKFTAVYDNSVNNPANPNPNQMVRWGAQTYEEMMITYLEYY